MFLMSEVPLYGPRKVSSPPCTNGASKTKRPSISCRANGVSSQLICQLKAQGAPVAAALRLGAPVLLTRSLALGLLLRVSGFTEMCSSSETGSYLRLIDLCITQL